jgi:hypothetical protein
VISSAPSAPPLLGAGPVFAAGRPLDPLSPGIKISLQIPGDFTRRSVFAKQLGVEYVSIPTRGGTYETFARYKQRVEAAGLKVANIGNANVHNMPEVTLNLPWSRSENRRIQAVPARPGQGRDLLHDLRAHGKRHLELATGNDARRRGCPRLPP